MKKATILLKDARKSYIVGIVLGIAMGIAGTMTVITYF